MGTLQLAKERHGGAMTPFDLNDSLDPFQNTESNLNESSPPTLHAAYFRHYLARYMGPDTLDEVADWRPRY